MKGWFIPMNNSLMNLLADAAQTAGEMPEMSTGATIIYYAVQFLPMILIFVIFYFMLIRPQRKKDKEAKAMLDSLKVGDRICTIGGIYGTISEIKNDTIVLKVGGQQTPMVIARWAIRSVEDAPLENDAEPTV